MDLLSELTLNKSYIFRKYSQLTGVKLREVWQTFKGSMKFFSGSHRCLTGRIKWTMHIFQLLTKKEKEKKKKKSKYFLFRLVYIIKNENKSINYFMQPNSKRCKLIFLLSSLKINVRCFLKYKQCHSNIYKCRWSLEPQ